MIIAASEGFFENFSDYEGTIVFINDGYIGNGLGNEGDRLVLTDNSGSIIDALSYGSDTTINVSWMKKVGEGHSMERRPAGGAFEDNANPTPGVGWSEVTPTPTPELSPTPKPIVTPTYTPTPTSTLEPMPAPTPVSSSTPNPTATSTPVVSPTLAPAGTVANGSDILINKVQYNPRQSGSDTAYEWLELYNTFDHIVSLIGWGISDNYETDELPSLNLSANGLVVVAASENFSVNFPNYNGTIVFIADGRIGNGLGNGGDHLILKDSAGTVIDEISYGDDDSVTSPPWPEVADGHSLERVPCGGQFVDNKIPTPGSCLLIYDPTPVPTPTPILTPTPVSALVQIPSELNSSDAINVAPSHSISLSRPASSMAYKSSSLNPSVESPGMSLRSLLITLSSALTVILVWTLYRRKAR